MTNPRTLKENKLILEGYQAKERARQDAVLICTNADKKEFEFVKVEDLPFKGETVGSFIRQLENLIGANYGDLLDLIKANKKATDKAILALAEQLDKEKFL